MAHRAVTWVTGGIYTGTGAAIVALGHIGTGLGVAFRIRETDTTTKHSGCTLALPRLRGLDTFGGLVVTGTTAKAAALFIVTNVRESRPSYSVPCKWILLEESASW